MIIFLHKLWILIGQIILWYVCLGFAFFITAIGTLMLVYIFDLGLDFIFDFSIFTFFSNWTNNLELNIIEKTLLIIPLVLFFMRSQLLWMSKDYNKHKDSSIIYNPFSDWGNITYMERNKEFYDKHYTNDYIKWKKAEEKKKRNKRKK